MVSKIEYENLNETWVQDRQDRIDARAEARDAARDVQIERQSVQDSKDREFGRFMDKVRGNSGWG